MKSLGFVEVVGVVAAIDALDLMLKTAGVRFVTWERKFGGLLVTIIVEGEVAAVQASVDAAMNESLSKPVAHAVIANPHEEVQRLVKMSASRPQNTV